MSIRDIAKNWTLPTAMLVGTLVYFVFAFVPQLDSVGNYLGPVFDEILPFFMFMILFVTFCKVDFRKLIPVSWHWWVALFQIVFIFIVVGSILAFHIRGNELILMEAVLVCIISPCAAAAPVITQKLGGNIEQMTTYTFLTNFITAVLVPVCFPLIDKAVEMSFLHAFFLILYKVFLVLVLPMFLAYIVKHHLHRLHRWILSIKDLSFYTWAFSLSIVTGVTVKNICHADTSVTLLLLMAFALHHSVFHRQIRRSFLRNCDRIRSGTWTEKHSLCSVDGLYISQSRLVSRTRLLHPLAKLYQ